MLTLALEAFYRGEISRSKLYELGADAGVAREALETALPRDGGAER